MTESYARAIEVMASSDKVFRSLTQEISKWWTTAADDASSIGKQAMFRFDETYNIMLIKELIPGRYLEWECIEQKHINKKLSAQNEWIGTVLCWEIEPSLRGSIIKFVHKGLVPELKCYEICEAGWDHFLLNSLKQYLETGIGLPHHHIQ